MGFLERISSVAASPRLRAFGGTPGPYDNFWYTPEGWMLPLDAAGIDVTPELALTLSHVFCAVLTISDDFGTFPCQGFQDLGDDGRARVKYSDPGIGALAYRLRWQPNNWQTAKAFWSTLAWQYLLRPAAYAELVYRPGVDGFVDQLIPRHPDRVRQERLPNSDLRFVLTELNGKTRVVTQDEMLVIRNTSTDGLNAIGRTRYGAKALSSGLVLQDFTRNYFKKGATAAIVVTYKGGQKEDADERDLHASISRFMSGSENAGGLLVLSEDLDTKQLGVEPQKAELLGLKNLSGRDVARLFKIPPAWLAIEGAQSYGSQVQDATNYTNRCQLPITVEFEQAIQRDLILRKDRFFFKFNMDYLQRGDLKSRMDAYAVGVQARILWPSEARVREDMSPDPRLDKLSEGDNRPGSAATAKGAGGGSSASAALASSRTSRSDVRQVLLTHAAAQRLLRRERAAVTKIAQRHPSDVTAWHAGLHDFYGSDHAQFMAETLRLPMDVARAFCAQHGSEFETKGASDLLDEAKYEAWERHEADELTMLALSDGGVGVDDWFDRRLTKTPAAPTSIHVSPPVSSDAGA